MKRSTCEPHIRTHMGVVFRPVSMLELAQKTQLIPVRAEWFSGFPKYELSVLFCSGEPTPLIDSVFLKRK